MQYLTEADAAATKVVWRRGEAGFVFPDPEDAGQLATETRVVLSANTTHALYGHGVIDELNRLPLQGTLGCGLQVLIPPPQLEPVRDILYRADSKTYGAVHEFPLEAIDADAVDYRIRIDNREYQHTLSGLQFLLRTAANEGMAAWFLV